MRIIMMGTGPFAVPTFQALIDSQHEIAALVTRPVPPPKGRRKMSPNPMRDVGVEQGLAILDPANVNDMEAIAALDRLKPELLIVCDYGQILAPQTLAVAPVGGINLHGSLLPKYRGAAPINYALLRGEAETGVTVIHMSPRLDAGNCLEFRSTPIGPDEDAVALETRLSQIGPEAVMSAINQLAEWDGESTIGTPQDPAQVTKAPRLNKRDGMIDWRKPADQIRNQVRAFKPWPASFTQLDVGKKEPLRVIIDQLSVVDSPSRSTYPGAILEVDRSRLLIQTGLDAVSIEKIQPSGKRVMMIDEFLRGYPVVADQQLSVS